MFIRKFCSTKCANHSKQMTSVRFKENTLEPQRQVEHRSKNAVRVRNRRYHHAATIVSIAAQSIVIPISPPNTSRKFTDHLYRSPCFRWSGLAHFDGRFWPTLRNLSYLTSPAGTGHGRPGGSEAWRRPIGRRVSGETDAGVAMTARTPASHLFFLPSIVRLKRKDSVPVSIM